MKLKSHEDERRARCYRPSAAGCLVVTCTARIATAIRVDPRLFCPIAGRVCKVWASGTGLGRAGSRVGAHESCYVSIPKPSIDFAKLTAPAWLPPPIVLAQGWRPS